MTSMQSNIIEREQIVKFNAYEAEKDVNDVWKRLLQYHFMVQTSIKITISRKLMDYFIHYNFDIDIPRLNDPTVVTVIENTEDINLKVDLVDYKGVVESINYKILNSYLVF